MKKAINHEPGVTEPAVCDACSTIPISHLALDLNPPLSGWASKLEQRGIEVVTDDLGRKAISRNAARALFTERDEEAAEMNRKQLEHMRQLKEAEAKRPKVRGIPAPPGAPLSAALEILAGAAGDDRGYHPLGYGETTGGRRGMPSHFRHRFVRL